MMRHLSVVQRALTLELSLSALPRTSSVHQRRSCSDLSEMVFSPVKRGSWPK